MSTPDDTSRGINCAAEAISGDVDGIGGGDLAPPERERPDAIPAVEPIRKSAPTTATNFDQGSARARRLCELESQQVSWWSVHRFIAAVLDQANGWPMAGTPAWCSLAHDDPRKWVALLDAAQHHALRMELAQEARAEASRDVSAAADWPAVAREIRQRTDFCASRPWARREATR